MLEILEEIMNVVAHTCQFGLELAGVVILVTAGITCLMHYFNGVENMRLEFARKISLALEFLMAGEILHTIVAKGWQELIVIGAIIVFRAVLTWEIGKEERELEEKLHGHKQNPAHE